jgi:hypothetical protein
MELSILCDVEVYLCVMDKNTNPSLYESTKDLTKTNIQDDAERLLNSDVKIIKLV